MYIWVLQHIWIYSYCTRSVTKYRCFMVSPCSYVVYDLVIRCIWTEVILHKIYGLYLWIHIYIFWIRYFFAEVFDFFRNFFLIVFHMNILFMILPLAIRLNHRPCFLAFVYIAISSLLKSYPSVSSSIFDKNTLTFTSVLVSSVPWEISLWNNVIVHCPCKTA